MKEGDFFKVEYQVTETVYNGYINIFQDKNPLHTSEEFAREKGFSSVVMHGGILTGFLSNFVGEQLPLKNVIIHSYTIQFVKPVYLHSTLLFQATITGIYESVKCALFNYSFSHDGKVVGKGKLTLGII